MASRRPTPRPLMELGIPPQPPPRRRERLEEALALCRDPSTPTCDDPNCRRKFHVSHRRCPYCFPYNSYNPERRPPPPVELLDEAQQAAALEQLLDPPAPSADLDPLGDDSPPPPSRDPNSTSQITDDGHL